MIVISVTKASTIIPFTTSAFLRIAKFVCRKEKVKQAELSFVLVNDNTIKRINKKFLNHDFVTDVITFPLEVKKVQAEIYINAQQAKRQAKEYLVPVHNEMIRLIVHGILHAIGYDDRTVIQKRKMTAIQERYVAELSKQQ